MITNPFFVSPKIETYDKKYINNSGGHVEEGKLSACVCGRGIFHALILSLLIETKKLFSVNAKSKQPLP